MTATLLSLGHGYASRALARALPPEWRFLATSRQPGAALLWPEKAAEALARATHLVTWVAPGPVGDPILPVIDTLPTPNLRWIGYASASSVYGVSGGGWIDDDTATAPSGKRGIARLDAEEAWQAFADRRDLPLARIRIAGIYGPGRSALDRMRAGTAQRIAIPGQVFNRIHVDDLARVTAAAAQTELAGPLIVADGAPAANSDVIAHAAQLLNLEPPAEIPLEDATLSPAARSFYDENKRLNPRRLTEDLRLPLLYPDYRAGLAAILRHELDAGRETQ